MKIMGIDPGFGRCGYGIVSKNGQQYILEEYGCIETSAKDSYQERVYQIHETLTKKIQEHAPQKAVVEELFFFNNAKTAFKVGQARGIILLTLIQHHIPILELTPLQVKQAVTGYGRADKKQMMQMVQLILKMQDKIKSDDAADALACAIAGFTNQQLMR